MNFEEINWKKEYPAFLEYLFSLKDEKYATFHGGLVKDTATPIIGVRTPILKQIAKGISKGNYREFINLNKHEYYEETILHGLVLTYIKEDFISLCKDLEDYIPYIHSWASCDIVICNMKQFSKNLEAGLVQIKKYVKSKNPWEVRVGLVLLLSYYVKEEYLDTIFKISESISSDDYYVKMANAWLLSICFIKYYDYTYQYFLNSKLDDWTYNKALQKAIESYRIKDKEVLRKLKRK